MIDGQTGDTGDRTTWKLRRLAAASNKTPRQFLMELIRGSRTVSEAIEASGMSRSTFYGHLRRQGLSIVRRRCGLDVERDEVAS